jgi:hypothetical protein
MFVGKARNLHQRGAFEKGFTQVNSDLISKNETGLKTLYLTTFDSSGLSMEGLPSLV